MAISNINPNNINGAYPVAGQDNDTQGFRDNFTNIKTSLQFAKDEIETLLNSTVSLTGTNVMDGGTIAGVTIQDIRESRVSIPADTALIELDHNSGHFHTATATLPTAMSVSFLNWPATGYLGRVVLHVEILDIGATVTLPVSVVENLYSLEGYDALTGAISFTQPGVYEYEFTSYDGGNTFYVKDFTNNITGMSRIAPVASIGAPGDLAGMIASDSNWIYTCTANYDGTTPIWKRAAVAIW